MSTIEITNTRFGYVAHDIETGERVGSWDNTAGANRGMVRGKYVQPETVSAWVERVQ